MKDQQPQSGPGGASNLPDVAVAASSSGGGGGSNASNSDAMKEASPVGNAASVREWIDVRNKKAALKLEKLDTDLKNYKSNSIKVHFMTMSYLLIGRIMNSYVKIYQAP